MSGSDSDYSSNSILDSDSDSSSDSSSVFINLVIFVSIHDSAKKLFTSRCFQPKKKSILLMF